jgi:hypothetical protein
MPITKAFKRLIPAHEGHVRGITGQVSQYVARIWCCLPNIVGAVWMSMLFFRRAIGNGTRRPPYVVSAGEVSWRITIGGGQSA